MSVSSMANIAFARRADVGTEGKGLDTLDEVAGATGAAPGTATSATSALSAIAAYIPTEVVTVYVAVLATVGVTQPANGPSFTPLPVYVLFLVLTPIVVWGLYASRAVSAGKRLPRSLRSWPKWEMVAATLAFAVWGAAMPSSPFAAYSWFMPALAGVVALVLSLLIGVFSPLFSTRPLANR
jgi:hypothetical protein